MTEAPAFVPPQSLEAEEHVLGSCLLSENAIAACVEVVQPSDFYRLSHGRMYEAILHLFAENSPVDTLTLCDELDRRGDLEEIGSSRVLELAAITPSAGNAAHYARIVADMALMRGLVQAGQKISRLGLDRRGDARDVVDQAEQVMFDTVAGRDHSDFALLKDTLKESFERLVELGERGEHIIGLPTGYVDLDERTSGLQPGNLIVLAGRPSMGKSAVALGITANVTIRTGLPACLFTLEMSRSEVTQRLMSGEALVDSRKIRNGRLDTDDWRRLTGACDKLSKAPLYVDDSGAITVMEIRSKARRLKLREPTLSLIVVDYLQLMTSGKSAENRVQEVSQISRALKVLARELEVPVLAVSQLSRAPEQRHDKRPILSDLRESGSIEQDADLVWFVYRDEYYHPEDTEAEGIAEVNIAKHRNGPTGMVKLAFNKPYAKFVDLAKDRP